MDKLKEKKPTCVSLLFSNWKTDPIETLPQQESRQKREVSNSSLILIFDSKRTKQKKLTLVNFFFSTRSPDLMGHSHNRNPAKSAMCLTVP